MGAVASFALPRCYDHMSRLNGENHEAGDDEDDEVYYDDYL